MALCSLVHGVASGCDYRSLWRAVNRAATVVSMVTPANRVSVEWPGIEVFLGCVASIPALDDGLPGSTLAGGLPYLPRPLVQKAGQL